MFFRKLNPLPAPSICTSGSSFRKDLVQRSYFNVRLRLDTMLTVRRLANVKRGREM